ncbi:hypothetical protein [Rhizobium sp. Leaf262]|uniref:hypothetical protein n=1 Tax=Rhizobium sp. Leaf262 TaxID=1736312 RepID=UPI000712463D|nr:hypothetical protein [Rhizobium sp. Leaf262]KQO76269.1 hypothetical protein ASF29_09820 [Rhizobium sp. Leaf262]
MLSTSALHPQDKIDKLVTLALTGLPQMHRNGAFGHTLRAHTKGHPSTVELEGDNLRYTAIVALGIGLVPEAVQMKTLGGKTASELARLCVERAEKSDDLGAITLAAWAAAEVGGFYAWRLFDTLGKYLASNAPIETVSCAWALTAGLAAARYSDTQDVVSLAAKRLLVGQSSHGVFPHTISAKSNRRFRAHVGCFADQVYPIQALSRLHVAKGDRQALAAAEACAEKICALQGPAGQWWWHYDTRNGQVVEGYPVYSVHQHGMAPMVLLDLKDAGGKDHSDAIIKGLDWLEDHPEQTEPLIDREIGVIWRKVARREPGKTVRWLSAITTAASPGLRIPGLDAIFPPRAIDYECRPYELGWLLYAWLSGGTVAALSCKHAEKNTGHSGGT